MTGFCNKTTLPISLCGSRGKDEIQSSKISIKHINFMQNKTVFVGQQVKKERNKINIKLQERDQKKIEAMVMSAEK